MIKFDAKERKEYTIVEIKLDEIISPEELMNLNPPKVNGMKGVIISGRAPIWLYCFLTHFYHPTKFVGVYDPRIGAIIVESHTKDKKVGEIIKMEE